MEGPAFPAFVGRTTTDWAPLRAPSAASTKHRRTEHLWSAIGRVTT